MTKVQAKAMLIGRSEVIGASAGGVVEDVESGSLVTVDESVDAIISVVVVGGFSVPGVGTSVVVSSTGSSVKVVVFGVSSVPGDGSVTSNVTVVGKSVVVVRIGGGVFTSVVVSSIVGGCVTVVPPGCVVVVASGASCHSSVWLNLIEIVIQMPIITHSAIRVESRAYTSLRLRLNFSTGTFLRNLCVLETSRFE